MLFRLALIYISLISELSNDPQASEPALYFSFMILMLYDLFSMSSFCKAGISVKDFDLDKKSYISADVLSHKIGINSIRIASTI